mgnify:CR=1 FL=1
MKNSITNTSTPGLGFLWARLAIIIGVFTSLGPVPAFAETPASPGDIEALRAEIAAMREAYEFRIEQLETKISSLEVREGTLEATAKRAEQAAKVSENSAQDAIDAREQAAATRKEIQEQFLSGERRPWSTIETPGKPLEFHGSLRSGFGVNGRGSVQVPFQAPDAAAKYRLGNQPDTYAELVFTSQFFPYGEGTQEDDPTFKAVVALDYGRNNSDLRDDSAFSLSQGYVEIGQLLKSNPSAKVWGGQRYYLDPSVYINNYTYLDMSGYGAGVEDFDVAGIGKFSAAWIGGTIDKLNSDGTPANLEERFAKNDFVFSFYDFDVPLGKGQVWLDIAWAQEGTSPVTGHFPDSQGFAFGFIHRKEDFYGGNNQAAIQYGYGSASNFDSTLEAPDGNLSDSWSFRVLDSFMIQPRDEFSLMAVLGYQESDNGARTHHRMRWITAGVRPAWHITRNYGISFEAAMDYTNPFVGNDGELYKFTIAPEITPDWNFAARPLIRLYFTYAVWSNSFKGRVGGDAYRRNTDGIAAGIQVEAAW